VVIYDANEKNKVLSGRINTLFITHSNDVSIISKNTGFYLSIPNIDNSSIINDMTSITFTAIRACLIENKTAFVVPKLVTSDKSIFSSKVMYEIPKNYIALDFQYFIYICEVKESGIVYDVTGTRGRLLLGDIKMKHLVRKLVSEEILIERKIQHEKVVSCKASTP
jgi:hypothetical protein